MDSLGFSMDSLGFFRILCYLMGFLKDSLGFFGILRNFMRFSMDFLGFSKDSLRIL